MKNNITQKELDELATALAIVEHYQTMIDNAKNKLRHLTDEEIEKINKGNKLKIVRQNYTKTIYSTDYQNAKKELELKFPPTKETLENHTIKLIASNYSLAKADIIISSFMKQNKSILENYAQNYAQLCSKIKNDKK